MNEIKNEVKNVYIQLVYLAGICIFTGVLIMMVTGAISAKKAYDEEVHRIKNVRENGILTTGYVISCVRKSAQKGGGYRYFKTYGFTDKSGNVIEVGGDDQITNRKVGDQVIIHYNPENSEDVIVSGDYEFVKRSYYHSTYFTSVFFSVFSLGVLVMLLFGFIAITKSEYRKIRENGLDLSEYFSLPVFLLFVFCVLCILAVGNFIRAMILYY